MVPLTVVIVVEKGVRESGTITGSDYPVPETEQDKFAKIQP
jgi:hypothetical protein